MYTTQGNIPQTHGSSSYTSRTRTKEQQHQLTCQPSPLPLCLGTAAVSRDAQPGTARPTSIPDTT
eukprot:2112682-Rhodomonas_salina.1